MSNRSARGAATAPAISEDGGFKLSRPLEITPGETVTELSVNPVTVIMMRKIRKAPFLLVKAGKSDVVPDFDIELVIRYMAAMTGVDESVLNGLTPWDIMRFEAVLTQNFMGGAST